MPKVSILLLLVLFIASCNSSSQEFVEEDDATESTAEGLLKEIRQGDFEIIVIDSCEYLIYTEDFGSTQQGYGFMAHKGNCNNPIHACPDTKIASTTE